MHDSIKHIGLDVHKNTIEVAIADGRGEVRRFGAIANRPAAVARLLEDLTHSKARLCFWYEAGPTGYGLHRQLLEAGHACHVVAPSLVPRRSGDRVKTDRRDAMMLARLGRAGELRGVWVPDEAHEALRDLSRCREDAKMMQRISRQQLGAFVLRHGRHYEAGKCWTKTHQRWLCEQKFTLASQQIVFQEYVDATNAATARVTAVTEQLAEAAKASVWWPVIQALCALRGVDLVTASTIVAELGDATRFDSPRQLMAYLGLVPSEHSSGQRRRQGGITKTGNGHVRRVLTESSWCYRFPARKTRHLERKARDASPAVQAIAWKAQKRLCGRYDRLVRGGKTTALTCVAIARELTGFIWAIYQQVREEQAFAPRASGAGGSRSAEPSATL